MTPCAGEANGPATLWPVGRPNMCVYWSPSMYRRLLAGFILFVLLVSFVPVVDAENRPPTVNEPMVIYGERIKPPVVPWYRSPLSWVLMSGLLGGAILLMDDDNNTGTETSTDTPLGSLDVTGPEL